jgi:hypothetical protein
MLFLDILQIEVEMLNRVIGSGGKTVKGIIESCGVDSVDVNDDGSVSHQVNIFCYMLHGVNSTYHCFGHKELFCLNIRN